MAFEQGMESCDEKANLFMGGEKKRPLFGSLLGLVGDGGDRLKKWRR